MSCEWFVLKCHKRHFITCVSSMHLESWDLFPWLKMHWAQFPLGCRRHSLSSPLSPAPYPVQTVLRSRCARRQCCRNWKQCSNAHGTQHCRVLTVVHTGRDIPFIRRMPDAALLSLPPLTNKWSWVGPWPKKEGRGKKERSIRFHTFATSHTYCSSFPRTFSSALCLSGTC